MSTDRKHQEAEFHDVLREGATTQRWSPTAEAKISGNPRWANFKYYSVERKTLAFVNEWLADHCRGARVLDFGCGLGDDSFHILREYEPEAVYGIDVSEASVRHCREIAQFGGFADRAHFEVMDGEDMSFPDAHFDLVVIYGVLHHVDLEKAMEEICRVLKPSGAMIATEALRHNPAIHAYRLLTPKLRTPWEVRHILGRRQIRRIAQYFERTDVRQFDLFTLAAVPFRNTGIFEPILALCEAIDKRALQLPGLRWLAWKAVITCESPRVRT